MPLPCRRCLILGVVAVLACGPLVLEPGEVPEPPAGDAGDAGSLPDATQNTADASPDASASDAESMDPPDAEVPAEPDAGNDDAGALLDDAGSDLEDAGIADSGDQETDAGAPDAGAGDAAEDAGASHDAGEETDDGGIPPPPVLGSVSAAQLYAELPAKAFLMIDTHVPLYPGVIPGTDARISYQDVDGLVAFIGPDLETAVTLTCWGDSMSRTAGKALVARGYRNVRYLVGGMSGWLAAGYSLAEWP